MPKLVVTSEEMKDRTFELTEDKITIGRLMDNQIRLENSSVSSHHAELTRKGEDYLIRDLNSTNGTRVNGQRIVETRLYHGDSVTLGHLLLQYFSTSPGAPQPLPTAQKKTVDLSTSIFGPGGTTRPTAYGSASPFAKGNRSKSKAILQTAVIVLGFIAVILLLFVIIRLVK